VLGSGSAWPIPRLGCDCRQCRSTDGRDSRTRPSILIDGTTLIDAGPDVYGQLRAAGTVPETVLLTHAHHDHALGLHELAKLRRLPLHCTREAEGELRRLFPRLDFHVFQLTPGVPIELSGGGTAAAFDVEHDDRFRTVGFRLTTPQGRAVAYIPDTRSQPASKLARGADLLLIDGTTREQAMSGHLSMAEGIEVARRLRADRTLFTHIGHRAGLHAELEEWLPDGFGVAHDGMVVDV
jgi:phosphoribosyl 1,2-cyclic phosphate phosphodiesterase